MNNLINKNKAESIDPYVVLADIVVILEIVIIYQQLLKAKSSISQNFL